MEFRCRFSVLFLVSIGSAAADDPLYRYEGDVHPTQPSAGWEIFQPCEDACIESLQGGHFVTTYVAGGRFHNYDLAIARLNEPQPPTFWVEWGFRSNRALPPKQYSCDAHFTVSYGHVFEWINMFGNAVISASGDDAILGLSMSDFHTYRFESQNGVHFRFSVDGSTLYANDDIQPIGGVYLQFGADAGCIALFPKINEWDYIRYGTIAYGEQIVSSDSPEGFVDARTHAPLDRFTLTFDEPNYLYIDEITVDVTAGVAPAVVAARRLDNGAPETVEIVLDRPIPYNATTRFTFNDGVTVQSIEYIYAPGDIDGDGDADLHDFTAFQNFFGKSPVTGVCLPLDFNADSTIDLLDFAAFVAALNGA